MRKTIDLFMCAMMGAKTNHDAPVDDKNAYDGRIIWRKCNRHGLRIFSGNIMNRFRCR